MQLLQKKEKISCQAYSRHTHLSKSEISPLFSSSLDCSDMKKACCRSAFVSVTCSHNFRHKESSACSKKPIHSETLCTQGMVSVMLCHIFGENMVYYKFISHNTHCSHAHMQVLLKAL